MCEDNDLALNGHFWYFTVRSGGRRELHLHGEKGVVSLKPDIAVMLFHTFLDAVDTESMVFGIIFCGKKDTGSGQRRAVFAGVLNLNANMRGSLEK